MAMEADRLGELLGDGAFELRFSLTGDAAVRVLAPRGPVAPRHAEPPDPPAPWSAAARCGTAVGWLLADRPPADAAEASAALGCAVQRRCALALQRAAAARSAMTAELLEDLTHRLSTDVSALGTVAAGAAMGMFGASELELLPQELRDVGEEAQRRISDAREVMATLEPGARREPEPLVDTLRAELAGAGADAPITAADGELAMALVPGAGWSACARVLAAALAGDARLAGATVDVRPHPDGWCVTAGARAPGGDPLPWTERALGSLVHVGRIAVAGGGAATATSVAGDRIRIELTVPAAPSGYEGA
jgi:hypothetical protein